MGKKDAGDAAENIKVLIRARPLNSKEKDSGYKSCISMDMAESTVTVHHVMGEPDRWTFDAVVNNSLTQNDIFVQNIAPLVDFVLDGYNATVFAYGQSGSGKTFTMTGDVTIPELTGVTPRAFRYVFDTARREQETHPGKKYSMSCSFVELYNNKVRDLLATKQEPLDVKENKDKTFFVKGAIIPQCRTVEDLINHIDEGNNRRQVASTELNADSSRSHSIFTLFLEMVETTEDGDVRSVTSKLNLVDLAGSERQGKTGATGDTLKEGCNINLSLSNLGTVIDCLVKGKPHIPFRSNPLTMLLKDSLGGNSKTCMFANINPSEHNISETISTLRFADRAKQIKNKPVVQLDAKDQKIKELTDQIHSLKDKLKMFEGAGVKGLEDELEQTKEKLDEANIALENAENSREADRNEFVERLQSTENEREELNKASKELQLSLEALKGEKELLEQRLTNESKRRVDWKKMLTLEIGEEDGDGDAEQQQQQQQESTADASENDDTIEKILERIRNMKHSFIDPKVHETKLNDAETRRKSAESEASELNTALDKVKKELSELTFNMDQATKKTTRLQEKLDREKESRRQIADTDVGVGADGASPARSKSFRRRSTIDMFGGMSPSSTQNNNTMMGSSSGHHFPASSSSPGETEKLRADLESKESIIKNLQEQISSGAELNTLQEELKRIKENGDEMQQKMKDQIDSLTASLAEPGNNDTGREKIIKKALLSKDAALSAALSQTKSLEDRLASLIDLRKSVAVGDIRNVEGAVIRHQSEIRSSILADLDSVASQRNQLLDLLSLSADASEEEIKKQIKSVVEENDALRKKAQDDEKSGGGAGGLHKAEASALRAALVDQKRAAEDAVKMVEKQSEELHEKITLLEEQVEKAQEDALEKFLSQHKKAKKPADGEEDEDEEEEEDPLRTALNVLQREKSALHSEVNAISRELQHARVELALKSTGTVGGITSDSSSSGGGGGDQFEKSVLSLTHHDEGSFDALRQECLRLRSIINKAGLSPSRHHGAGSSPSKTPNKNTNMNTDDNNTNINNNNNENNADGEDDELQSSFLEIEQSMAKEVSVANQQASELRDELESAKAEVEEANDRRDAAIKERDTVQEESAELKTQLRTLQQTLEDTKTRVSDLETESEKQKKTLEAQYSQNILSLESRLREKSEHLAEEKKLVEGQTSVANSLRERTEILQAQLEKQQKDANKKEQQLNDRLEQQETSFQKLLTRRLEEQKEQHQKALIRKDEETYDLRKKMKKLEDKMDKLRQMYDAKICEYEELAEAMEEQKMSQLQQMVHARGSEGSRNSQAVKELREADKSRRGVDDAIKSAREERARRNDAFSGSSNNQNGSSSSSSHAAGSASVVARARREIGGTITPPTDEIRSGYGSHTARNLPTTGTNSRVIVNNDTYRGGGTGYTGYGGISNSNPSGHSSAATNPNALAPLPLAPMPPSGSTRPTNAAPVRGFPGINSTIGPGSPEKNDDDMYYF